LMCSQHRRRESISLVDDESLNYQWINYEPCVDEGLPRLCGVRSCCRSAIIFNQIVALLIQYRIARIGPSGSNALVPDDGRKGWEWTFLDGADKSWWPIISQKKSKLKEEP